MVQKYYLSLDQFLDQKFCLKLLCINQLLMWFSVNNCGKPFINLAKPIKKY